MAVPSSSEDDESALLKAAKISILKKIAGDSDDSLGPQGVLKLAMAYTVLDRGRLPGESPQG